MKALPSHVKRGQWGVEGDRDAEPPSPIPGAQSLIQSLSPIAWADLGVCSWATDTLKLMEDSIKGLSTDVLEPQTATSRE